MSDPAAVGQEADARGGGPGTLLSQLELRPPVALPPDATISDAARAMMGAGVSAVVLAPGGAVITERDLVHALASGLPPTASAAAVASPEPLVVNEEASALEALATMLRHGFRHLVVVDRAGRPRSLLTLSEAAAVVLGGVEVPPWLAGLRLALHVEMHVD